VSTGKEGGEFPHPAQEAQIVPYHPATGTPVPEKSPVESAGSSPAYNAITKMRGVLPERQNSICIAVSVPQNSKIKTFGFYQVCPAGEFQMVSPEPASPLRGITFL
jgi:hypothetical protein